MTFALRLFAASIAVACLAGGVPVEGSVTSPPTEPPAVSNAAEPDSASEDGLVQFEWEATYASWYSFQGLDYSNRRSVSQPEVSATIRGISIGVWGNVDHSRGELNEVDMTLQWGWEGDRFSGGLGYMNLQYPHRPDWEPSQEVFGEFGFEGPLDLSASLHWDVDAGRGRYWEFGLGKELSTKAAAILLATSVYVQDDYYGMTGVTAVETRVGVRREWGGVAWEPSLARVSTWENGDFQGPDAVPAGWLFRLSLSPP